jgi:flagellar hook-associated protein 2
MAISMTMPSGLDTNSLVGQLVELEQLKVTSIENKKNSDQLKIDAYSKLRGMLMDLQTKANDISTAASFDIFKSTSTNPESVTIKGTTGSVDGQYDVNVYQLASNEKMISADNKITDQKAALASQGIIVGEISVDGVSITIGENDTIQDLRAKINTATDSKGIRGEDGR